MTNELAKTIGTAAKQARKVLRLTQEDTAERIDVSVEFYARIERGTSLPSILTFARIVSALGVSADALLGQLPLTTVSTGTVWTPPPPSEKPEIRRVLRRLRNASPGTLRLISLLLKELDDTGPAEQSASANSDGSGSDANSNTSPVVEERAHESNDAHSDPVAEVAGDEGDGASADAIPGQPSAPVGDSIDLQALKDQEEQVIAASSVLGTHTKAPGMRSASRPSRIFVHGSTAAK